MSWPEHIQELASTNIDTRFTLIILNRRPVERLQDKSCTKLIKSAVTVIGKLSKKTINFGILKYVRRSFKNDRIDSSDASESGLSLIKATHSY